MRRGRGIIGMMGGLVGAGMLSACGQPADGAAAGPAARAMPVAFEGADYLALIGPGPAGERLTAAGALPVAGRQVTVTRPAAALHYSEGRVAKRVAEAACLRAGGRFNAEAIGRMVAPGSWQFAGGCA